MHGLATTAEETWRRMISLCRNDGQLRRHKIGCYSYPTTRFRLPWTARISGIEELAHGLRTEISARYADTQVVIVGHSLGGLVARQYIVDELKAGRPIPHKLALFAVPHNGAPLAEFGRLSWKHRQLRQLQRHSDALRILNEEWIRLNVEDELPVMYVLGGGDRIVAPDNACPFVGRQNTKMLIGHDHSSIIQPDGDDDIRFKVLQSFIVYGLDNATKNPTSSNAGTRAADPLFDMYTISDEPFYLRREIDDILQRIMSGGHIWVSGPSGTGKTAALRRCAINNGWHLKHIFLSSYLDKTALGMLRALCTELNDDDEPIKLDAPAAELISIFRTKLRSISSASPTALLIEEIPLPPGDELDEFLRILAALTLSVETDSTSRGRVAIAVSSLNDPLASGTSGLAKVRERVQFLKFDRWGHNDTKRLLDLLLPIIRPDTDQADRDLIILESQGSPRFVKMMMRHWRNLGSSEISPKDLVQRVKVEHL